MFPESKDAAPDGTVTEVTVWAAVSALDHTTVLFTPTTTVILSGE